MLQVLKDRSEWDKLAKYYVHQRSITAGFQPSLPVCRGLREVVYRVKGRKDITTTKSKNAFF